MSTIPHLDQRLAAPAEHATWPRSLGIPTLGTANRAAWNWAQPLIVAVILRAIPGPLRITAWFWTCGYALLGRRQAILSLVLLFLLNLFTHAAGLPPGNAAIFRHLTIFSAALSVFVLYAAAPPRSRTPTLLMWTGILNVLLIFHSVFISTSPDISTLKAISYIMTIQTLLTAWSRLSPFERIVTEKQLWGVFYGLSLLSIPLVVTGAGYFRNGRGFQGLLEHPQAFGPMMGIFSVWLFATWLTDRRMSNFMKAVLVLSIVWIFMAEARSGAGIFLVGVVVAIVSRPLAAALNRWQQVPKILLGRLLLLTVGIVAMGAIAGPRLASSAQEFIRKEGRSTTVTDAAWESRGFLIERMQANIRERPFTGIGFGVASAPELYTSVVRDPIFGITVMAATEKGVLPVAVVEELGWPLALLFLPWFLALLVNAIRAGPRYAGVCAAALTLNMSECLFFSPGGGGLIVLVLVTMAATAPPAGSDAALASRHGGSLGGVAA
jgi:hypothetical protein